MPSDSPTPRHVGIAILGAGFSGIGAAAKLELHGYRDYLVFERGTAVGGTWRDNHYPGAACDVPSHLYSYSFAPNPSWSRSFSPQPEIHRYLHDVADRYGVIAKTIFGCTVNAARWNDTDARWEIDSTHGEFTADVLIGAFGVLVEPSMPEIPGIETFAGEVFHSSRWNHDVDLTGKRVAVIGTGASAIQIIPAIAGTVGRLDVYQRTAAWVLPRADRPYTRLEQAAFRLVPGYRALVRARIYTAREYLAFALTRGSAWVRPLELLAKAKLHWEIRDPGLRTKLRPKFRLGCERILLSNNYYPALARDNVEVVTEPIAEILSNAVITADRTIREVDALVVATGFQVVDSPVFDLIRGRDGAVWPRSSTSQACRLTRAPPSRTFPTRSSCTARTRAPATPLRSS
ncbi:flavin-containing monooxygenase [Nocardia crassostreae]|uniref:flavin-containing monooxygenase n=1 Tax=Nocardia crassostreae TaxID=53428 RepID=UPI000ACC899A